MESATGLNCANAVYDLLKKWNSDNEKAVVAMCFDTPSSNTGQYNGACVLLEQNLGRCLLALACRHHIFEIIIGAIFTTVLGQTKGPTIPIFLRFKKSWASIDKLKFEPGVKDDAIKNALTDVHDEIIIFCQDELKKPMIRHDYQELLNLTLIFLGGYTKNVSFREPGAIHQARWMAN